MTVAPLPAARFADFIPPALIAGLVCGFALGLPFVGMLTCLCCAPVILCGLWAAYLLSRRLGPTGTPFLVVHGALAGALAGLVCGVTGVIVGAACKAVFGDPGRKIIEDTLRNMSSMPPETRQALDQAFSRGMSVAMFFLALIFTPLIYAGFAALGGLIGGLIFKPKAPPFAPASSAPIDITPAGGGEPPINA